jgi:uncharacterized protein with HEPN domain
MNDKDLSHFKLMLGFAKRVQRRIESVSLDDFFNNEDAQDMILYAIGQVGENANAISEEMRDAHNDILWNAVIGIRNRVFHSYGDVDMRIVYKTAVEHMPKLIVMLQKIVDKA